MMHNQTDMTKLLQNNPNTHTSLVESYLKNCKKYEKELKGVYNEISKYVSSQIFNMMNGISVEYDLNSIMICNKSTIVYNRGESGIIDKQFLPQISKNIIQKMSNRGNYIGFLSTGKVELKKRNLNLEFSFILFGSTENVNKHIDFVLQSFDAKGAFQKGNPNEILLFNGKGIY